MALDLATEVYRTDLERIVVMVFRTMLGLDVTPVDRSWSKVADTLTAAVHFAGQWKGGVYVECRREQALDVTARLMSIPRPTEVDEDVLDAMGEIANMVGGNVKSVMPRGVELSAPTVVEGADYALRFRTGDVVTRAAFDSGCGTFWITLVEKADPHD
ncbi:MAG: chemotaxis protein CheX [Bryobacteraceae bacterium]